MGFLPIFLLLSQDAPGSSGGQRSTRVYPNTMEGSTLLGQPDLREYKGPAKDLA